MAIFATLRTGLATAASAVVVAGAMSIIIVEAHEANDES